MRDGSLAIGQVTEIRLNKADRTPTCCQLCSKLFAAFRITIYDRSWYGRVLVERVEGFAQPSDWQRAYSEINQFEEQLVEDHVLVFKFWLHISPEEQLIMDEISGAARSMTLSDDLESDHNWLSCNKDGSVLTAACGPMRLEEALERLLDWLDEK